MHVSTVAAFGVDRSRWLAGVVAAALAVVACSLCTNAALAEEVTVYRDEFGVPHIYAETLSGAAYGAGYSQAEDRLEQLLQNYRLAAGTMSELAGPSLLERDYRARMWQHDKICREKFTQMNPKLQDACKAYIQGVEKFMADHPEQTPKWAQKLEPHFPVMLGRFIIWGWPEGEAEEDLENVGLKAYSTEYHGSNEWLISAKRSANGSVIALIDPHLSWYGPFRFYEQRMYAAKENFNVSGACILGVPFPGLGHSQYASVAMTTGGPDTADVYEETVNPANPLQYRVDGQWRDMTVRNETIRVREGEKLVDKEVRITATKHGPVVARKGDKAYTMAIPYADELGLMDELYRVHTSQNLDQVKQALSTCQLMAQNIMIGTVDGDTFYLRTGRVPIRNHGLPTDRPVPGDDSKNDYAGIHPMSDLVQITNPPAGYMQNCNIAPEYMMKNSPLTPDKCAKRPYLYNATPGPAHQRAQMVTEVLHADDSVTTEEALDLAFCPRVLGAEAWQKRLAQAWQAAASARKTGDAKTLFESIDGWNHRSDVDSTGAMAFYAFKMALGDKTAAAVEVPSDLSDEQLLAALDKAAATLREKHQRLDVKYGDVFRVGRADGKLTYPVGGGTLREAGMATPRAISFSQKGNLRIGHTGQTSTQLVILSKPPKSYMVLPLGESDHPETGHWDDQAQKLFSAGKAKDTFFMDRAGLMPHVKATKKLTL